MKKQYIAVHADDMPKPLVLASNITELKRLLLKQAQRDADEELDGIDRSLIMEDGVWGTYTVLEVVTTLVASTTLSVKASITEATQ